MATIIIDHDGGLLNEVYSNLPEQVTVHDYVSDDQYDHHAPTYAACTYAAEFGGLTAHLGAAAGGRGRVWHPLHRRPEALSLIAEQYRAKAEPAATEQVLDAAYAAGYLEAAGDLNDYVKSLEPRDGIGPWQIHRVLQQFQDRQLEKFIEFCKELNDPEEGRAQ